MGKGINKAIILGNLGGDPETRYMPSGAPVASFSIATSESWVDKQSGNKQERTEWHNCIAFNRLAEIVQEYTRKGSKVYIEGKLRTKAWEDSGVKKYKTEIVVKELQMLDSRQDQGHQQYQASQAQQPHYATQQQRQTHAALTQQQAPPPNTNTPQGNAQAQQ